MTEIELVRVYFPRINADAGGYVLWNCTCFPMGGLSEVRKQLAALATVVRPKKRGWIRRLNREIARIDSDLMAELARLEQVCANEH